MDRVGLVVLSIMMATALLLGASYGALYLPPLLSAIPTLWMIAAGLSLAVLAALLHWCRKRALSH